MNKILFCLLLGLVFFSPNFSFQGTPVPRETPDFPVFMSDSLEYRFSQETSAKIDAVGNRYLELGRFSGTILLAREGAILYNKSFGLANYEEKQDFTDSTAFKIGDLSELFIAEIIRTMSEKGTLEMDAPVSHYLPQIKGSYSVNDLLAHNSGLPVLEEVKALYPGVKYTAVDLANIANVDKVRNGKSDLGYIILGLLIEKIGEMDFQKALEIYFPRFENTYFKRIYSREAKGYLFHNYRGKGLELEESSGFDEKEAFSSKGIKSTAKDLYALTNRLSQKEIKMSGYVKNDGFSYSLFKDGNPKLTIIILSNRRHPVAGEISGIIKAIYEDDPYELPLPRKEVPAQPEFYKEFAGSYSLNPEVDLQVVTANDSLFILMGPNRVHLKQQSEYQFFMGENDAEIRFVRDTEDKIEKAILFNGFLTGEEILKVKD